MTRANRCLTHPTINKPQARARAAAAAPNCAGSVDMLPQGVDILSVRNHHLYLDQYKYNSSCTPCPAHGNTNKHKLTPSQTLPTTPPLRLYNTASQRRLRISSRCWHHKHTVQRSWTARYMTPDQQTQPYSSACTPIRRILIPDTYCAGKK